MKVELLKPVRAVFAQTELGTSELPTEDLEQGESVEIEGPGQYVFGQPTGTVVDAEGNRFFILVDELLDAIAPDARPDVSTIVQVDIVTDEGEEGS